MDKGAEPVYVIYMMTEPWHLDETGWPNCGIREFTGFYHEKDVAIRAVEENWCDLQDKCFHAAEVCEIVPGLYPHPPQAKCVFFEWNKKEEKFERRPFPKLGKDWDSEFEKE